MPRWLTDYLYGLSPAEYNFLALALFIGVLFAIYQVYQTHRRYRFISDTPSSRIISAAQGYVELKGLAELIPDSRIVSPFSSRKCIWYQCKVEIRRTSGKRSYWVEESNQQSEDIFYLKDDTGCCVVIPEAARVIPSQQRVWYGNSPQQRHLPVDKKHNVTRLFGFGNYRFTEKLIMVADPLYVIGEFETIQKSVNPQTIQQQVEALIQYWKTNPMRFLKPFDRDNNGKIQQQEWKLVRQQANMQIMQQHQQQLIHTIHKPHETDQPFLISTVSEQELLRKKRLSLFLYLMLFFSMTFFLISMINLPK
jgi:hypothetical protein